MTEEQNSIVLTSEEFDAFYEGLSKPPRANAGLRELMRRKAPWKQVMPSHGCVFCDIGLEPERIPSDEHGWYVHRMHNRSGRLVGCSNPKYRSKI